MARSQRLRKSRAFLVQKPHGQITQRVQACGPEHFGVVCFDCAKVRSKFFLCDFFGQVLIEPTEIAHNQPEFRAAVRRIRQTMEQRRLTDSVVAIERTGAYHRPVQEAFRQAGFETRIVHPFASKQFRQPADPGNKTDDTDLAAIFRATVNGFGLLEPVWPEEYQQLQWLVRQRRDLVQKASRLRCQIRECLHALMPGYVESFGDHFFDSPVALAIARRTGSAQALLELDIEGLHQLVRDGRDRLSCRRSTLTQVLDWARAAATAAHPHVSILRASLERLDDDRRRKTEEIAALEQLMAHTLVRTPYVLLLALPGVNVVVAAELAAEIGPISNYADANCITGRAGLAPSRYQSDRVDRADGPLRRRGNRRLRHALLQAADNLMRHNHYYMAKSHRWRQQGRAAGWIHVKVAKCFSRLLFAMLTNRCIYPHPSCQSRHYILDKLLAFHLDHDSDMKPVLDDLDQAARHFPKRTLREEGQALKDKLKDVNRARKGPVALASLIPEVLARLGITGVQSKSEVPG